MAFFTPPGIGMAAGISASHRPMRSLTEMIGS